MKVYAIIAFSMSLWSAMCECFQCAVHLQSICGNARFVTPSTTKAETWKAKTVVYLVVFFVVSFGLKSDLEFC